MSSTWITEDGTHRVRTVSTVDRGAWLSVEMYSGTPGRKWVVRDTIPITGDDGPDYVTRELRRYLDPSTLVVER